MRPLLSALVLLAAGFAAAQDFVPPETRAKVIAIVGEAKTSRARAVPASYQGPGQRPGCAPAIAEKRAVDAVRMKLKPGTTAELHYSLQQSASGEYVMFYFSPAFDYGSGPVETLGGVTLDQFCGSVFVGPVTSVSAQTIKY